MIAWQEDIFNNFIKLNRGFDLPNHSIVNGTYPVVASTSIKAFHEKYKIQPPCVVTGRSGSLGKVQYINQKSWPLNTTLYVKDFKGNNPKFVYFFLKIMHLENYNAGAGVPSLNQNHLHQLKIKIPQIEIQKKIAAILSAYDDLIENNNRRIAILEKMAEEIYKEWFVRMRFPEYEKAKFDRGIPVDWKVKKLERFCERVTDGTHDTPKPVSSGYYLVTGKNIKEGFVNFNNIYKISEQDHINISKRSGLVSGDILFSNIGTLGSMAIVDDTIEYSVKNVIIFKPKRKYQTQYLYYMLKEKFILEQLLLQSSGASQQFISLGVARGFKIFDAGENLIRKFNQLIHPIYTEKKVLNNQNNNLKQTRDRLLTRLISGKLSVEDLDIQFPKSMNEESDA